jgi:short-subunit dehydrogenase
MKKLFRLSCLLLILWTALLLCSCATHKAGNSIQKRLKGKTVVVVGASSGFGKGVALELGRFGCNVVVAAPDLDAITEVASLVETSGGKALAFKMDISKAEEVGRLCQVSLEKFGTIDVWVNMAGVGAIGRFWDIPLNDYSRLLDVNLKGIVYGSQAAVKQFLKQGYGTLINMGSVESEVPLAYHAVYAASKGGVRSLGEALSQELRLGGFKKIKVVTVEPWAVDTPFWTHAANYSGGTTRMAAMDPPEKVVNATVRRMVRPRKEAQPGWKAKASWISHHLFPHFTERVSANIVHRYQIKNAPPTPHTDGSLYSGKAKDRGVEGGVRRRMKKEKAERKK